MFVKYHMDDMVRIVSSQINWNKFSLFSIIFTHRCFVIGLQKRVSRLKRQYYWTAIPHSPFTLVITYPEPYGSNRVQIRYEDEIHRIHAKGNDVLSFFEGHRWRVHPDWWVILSLKFISIFWLILSTLIQHLRTNKKTNKHLKWMYIFLFS